MIASDASDEGCGASLGVATKVNASEVTPVPKDLHDPEMYQLIAPFTHAFSSAEMRMLTFERETLGMYLAVSDSKGCIALQTSGSKRVCRAARGCRGGASEAGERRRSEASRCTAGKHREIPQCSDGDNCSRCDGIVRYTGGDQALRVMCVDCSIYKSILFLYTWFQRMGRQCRTNLLRG